VNQITRIVFRNAVQQRVIAMPGTAAKQARLYENAALL